MRLGISRVRIKAGWVSDKFVDGRPILVRVDQQEQTIVTAKPPEEPEVGTLIVKVMAARGLPKMDLFLPPNRVGFFRVGNVREMSRKRILSIL